ncbi:MAG: hypothetical protein JNL67_06655 [Planctomycetaceae bacterium]|nr:hypothetical protein [Planctomycetaceae bacterium]
MNLRLFASCAPGIEPLLAQEISELLPADRGVSVPTDITATAGGVLFAGDQLTAGHALVGLGLAARVLVRIDEFPVRHFNELEKRLTRIDWHHWLLPSVPVIVRATSKKSKLYHSGAIEQRVQQQVEKSLGHTGRASETPITLQTTEEETPGLVVRLEHDLCTISLDISGTPLHRRGYRKNPFRAPLREDLARALVVASGWDGQTAVVDPCCGSGTILIEAAAWASRIPPGLLRSFAMVATPLADRQWLQGIKRERLVETRAVAPKFLGADCDPQALSSARENWDVWSGSVTAAATLLPRELNAIYDTAPRIVCPQIEWVQQDVRKLEWEDDPKTILTNPPWGDRIQARQHLNSIYQRLGELRRTRGVRLALITSQRELAYKTGIRLRSAFLTDAGGVKANVFVEGT